MNDQRQAYYQDFAKQLARQIVPPDEIKPFVGDHPDLVGDFAETQVRKFIREMLPSSLRVSRGAVITPASYGSRRAQQVDTIIWTPNPMPAVLEVDDFALVPWENSMGILEIKSSAYSNTGKRIAEILDSECDLTCGRRPAEARGIPAALGVIVLQKEPIYESKLKELIAKDKVVVLLTQEDSEYQPNVAALIKFVNHLAGIRRRASQLCDQRIDPISYNPSRDETATSI
jgi:hypothetical protein